MSWASFSAEDEDRLTWPPEVDAPSDWEIEAAEIQAWIDAQDEPTDADIEAWQIEAAIAEAEELERQAAVERWGEGRD
jgi:hypothetical protein